MLSRAQGWWVGSTHHPGAPSLTSVHTYRAAATGSLGRSRGKAGHPQPSLNQGGTQSLGEEIMFSVLGKI